MALEILYTSGTPHGLWPVDPTATFEPGMIGGLKQIGTDIFVTVSDGVSIPPMGVIDEIKTEAFSRPVVDDKKFIPSTGVSDGYGHLVSPVDVAGFARETNIVPSSFSSNIEIILEPKHGAITVPAGTQLNHQNDNGDYDGFEILMSYNYRVADMPGDDSTVGSGLMTLHIFRGIFATDQFCTLFNYMLNAPLYVGTDGKLTTQQNGITVAQVTGPPSTLSERLEFLWL